MTPEQLEAIELSEDESLGSFNVGLRSLTDQEITQLDTSQMTPEQKAMVGEDIEDRGIQAEIDAEISAKELEDQGFAPNPTPKPTSITPEVTPIQSLVEAPPTFETLEKAIQAPQLTEPITAPQIEAIEEVLDQVTPAQMKSLMTEIDPTTPLGVAIVGLATARVNNLLDKIEAEGRRQRELQALEDERAARQQTFRDHLGEPI